MTEHKPPTAQELVDVIREDYVQAKPPGHIVPVALAKRVTAVLALHVVVADYEVRGRQACRHCQHPWPCDTFLALNGEAQ